MSQSDSGASASGNGIAISYGMVVLFALLILLALGRVFGSIRGGYGVSGSAGV